MVLCQSICLAGESRGQEDFQPGRRTAGGFKEEDPRQSFPRQPTQQRQTGQTRPSCLEVTMISTLESLIGALRNELQQYGEMLALLDEQHAAVKLQGADDILQSIAAVNAQSGAIQAARESRQVWQRQLAEALHQDPNSAFLHLIPLLPEAYRPLVAALLQENNELLDRVRERAQQNHSLLRQSMEITRSFITTLAPEGASAAPQSEADTVLMERTDPPICEAIA
jgi:hypothetical protein